MPEIVEIVPKEAQRKVPSETCRHVVAVLAYDGVSPFELGMAIEAFELGNASGSRYEVLVCAEHPSERLRAGAIDLMATLGLDQLDRATTIVVPGCLDIDDLPSIGLLERLARHHRERRRIVSICSGVFLLAAAGLLDGRRAAVHWAQAAVLERRYPLVQVDDKVLFIDDGDILSSAGRAAGLDLCLHIIRKDHGHAVARDVARRLVVPAHRDGGQAQYITRPVPAERSRADGMAELCAWMLDHIADRHRVDALAARCRMSRRTFIRRFEDATGLPPGEWLAQQRAERARSFLEDSDVSVDHIAIDVGFGTAETLRYHFTKRFRTTPTRYRAQFRTPG